jgi:DNA-binding MarR family transcriptional regulator
MSGARLRGEHASGATRDEPGCPEGTPTALAMRDLSTSVQRARRALARRAGLTPTELHVLEHLLPGPMGYTELAQRIGVSKSAISNVANRLVRRGLVSAVLDVDDGRRAFLELSEIGRREMASSLGPVFAVLDALDQSVTADERQVIGRYLRDATRAYEAVEALVSRPSPGVEQ